MGLSCAQLSPKLDSMSCLFEDKYLDFPVQMVIDKNFLASWIVAECTNFAFYHIQTQLEMIEI